MKSTLIGALIGASALLGALPLSAATFTPNVFDDPTPVAAPNGCSSGGRCSLREAVLSSNASNEPNTIVLGEGEYDLTIPEAGNPESGDLDFTEADSALAITIQGSGSSLTKIVASAGLNERIMELSVSDASATITGVTFQNGNTPGFGGGLLFSTGNSIGANDPITLRDCVFLNNQSTLDGGGAYLSGSSPLIDVDGARFEGNRSGTNGGGLALSGGSSVLATTVKNIVALNNKALDGNGGGISQSAADGARFSNLTVEGNQALNPSSGASTGRGGGVYCSNGASTGDVSCEILDSVIANNQADSSSGSGGIGGGGFYGNSPGLFRIVNTTIDGNTVLNNGDGGGIYVDNGGGIQILGSTLMDNQAESGGGLWYNGVTAAVNEITNSTFSGNEVSGFGGAMYLEVPGGFPISNVTIADNSATTGGGIYAFGPQPAVQNSILVDNSGASGTADCGSQITSDGYNIFASSSNANCKPNGIAAGTSPNDSSANPQIGALADNGGLTFTHALLEGSPALDGGNPAGCEDGNGDPLTTDQRGFVRPAGTRCDIGAVETSVADLAIVKTADDEVYVVGDEITYTLTATSNGPDESRVLLSDVLPTAVTFISADAPCVEASGTVTCDLGNLAAGDSVAVNIVVEASDDGVVDNTATVSGADIETDPANDSSTVSVNVLSNGGGGDSGGCSLGLSSWGSSAYGWALLGIGLFSSILLRRRLN